MFGFMSTAIQYEEEEIICQLLYKHQELFKVGYVHKKVEKRWIFEYKIQESTIEVSCNEEFEQRGLNVFLYGRYIPNGTKRYIEVLRKILKIIKAEIRRMNNILPKYNNTNTDDVVERFLAGITLNIIGDIFLNIKIKLFEIKNLAKVKKSSLSESDIRIINETVKV